MFWDRFYSLCLEKGLDPTAAGRAVGVSSAAVTGWRQGAEPRRFIVDKLALFFGCLPDYLLGKIDVRRPPAPPGIEKSPAPEGAGEEWIADQLRGMLVGAGWIGEGDTVTNEQQEFLLANIRVLKAHFQGGKNS